MMQVGVSQLIMHNVPMADFLSQAAVGGYEVVELCMAPEGSLTPQTSQEDLKHLAEQVRAAGLEAVSMT
ncbi:MAG TPA: hypothetical protein VNA16_01050, partial [Abditibacteriaceae bacterium]|nr:hypothetical protein [Abditibacteriaceae bacterium]